MEESNLTIGGHVLFAHYQQSLTEYLTGGILQQIETVAVAHDLSVAISRSLDTGALAFGARINLNEWRHNPASGQYVSVIKPKGGRRAVGYFQDFIGVTESVDSPGETRTLLKAFSDYVKAEDLADDTASEKSHDLVAYVQAQSKTGSW